MEGGREHARGGVRRHLGERGYRLMVRMRRAGGGKIEEKAAQRDGEWQEDWGSAAAELESR